MKIVVDEQIPYLRNFFSAHGDILALPAEEITAEAIENADVLLVGTVVKVNASLLSTSSVRFVGSAAAGIDHMDTPWLKKAGIPWAYAAGSNAKAVADYVLLSVAHLKQLKTFKKSQLRAGVIGVGRVGREVVRTLEKIGFDVIVNDPRRAKKEFNFVSTPLEKFYDLDLICLHTPLITTGLYPTFHLINEDFLSKLNKNTVLLNASRGACVDSKALKKSPVIQVLDVWEFEPNIDAALAESAFLATPHIAGYSQPAKYRAAQQLYKAFCNHFEIDDYINPEEDPSEYVTLNILESNWIEQSLKTENLQMLSNTFKEALQKNPEKTAEIFKNFRKGYRFRPEFIF